MTEDYYLYGIVLHEVNGVDYYTYTMMSLPCMN